MKGFKKHRMKMKKTCESFFVNPAYVLEAYELSWRHKKITAFYRFISGNDIFYSDIDISMDEFEKRFKELS
jgi:hypothetical protein